MVGPSFPSVTMVRPNPPIWTNDEKYGNLEKIRGNYHRYGKSLETRFYLFGGLLYLYLYLYIYSIYIQYIYIYRVWIFTVKHEYRIGCNGIYHQQCDGEIMIFFVERTAKDEI